jgi:hypothetical protein
MSAGTHPLYCVNKYCIVNHNFLRIFAAKFNNNHALRVNIRYTPL